MPLLIWNTTLIKGGFKYEVQHGITIDETPLQAPPTRLVRMIILEKGLADRVEILLAPTRPANSC